MAISAQGAVIRRESSAAASTVAIAATAFVINSTTLNRTGSSAFVSDGVSTGMIFRYIGATATATNPKWYTVKAVSASVVNTYESMTTSTAISVAVEFHAMSNVGSVISFSVPTGSAGVMDMTHLGSVAKEKAVGLADEGQFTFGVIYDSSDAIQWALKSDRANRTRRLWQVRFSDASSNGQPTNCAFYGYLTGYSISGSVDNRIEASLTVEIDGPAYFQQKAS